MKSVQLRLVLFAIALCVFSGELFAQFGGLKSAVGVANKANDKLKDVELTDQDEVRLGEAISAKIREKYGVVQDPAIHKYVSLVGAVVGQKVARPNVPWHFIVLDTDGVNALAAPGGYIHITRGALALMKNEAELAGVLAHELTHVTNKHTIKAIQKGKVIQMGASETSVSSNPQLFQRLVDESAKLVLAGFGRAEELEADTAGFALAGKAGYAANGLQTFLNALNDRNKESDSKQGLFASHPEMNERLQKLEAAVADAKLASTVVLKERYVSSVKFQTLALDKITVVEDSTQQPATATNEGKKDDKKAEEKKPSRFSLGGLKNTVSGGNENKQSASVTGSGGSRGVDRERAAKGGSNPAAVSVTLTAAEISDFAKAGNLVV